MDWTKFPPELSSFQILAEKAIAAWLPFGEFDLDSLSGGVSGAAVFKADFRPSDASSPLNGKFVLKVSRHSKWLDQPNEIDAHLRAVDAAPDFAEKHIPELLRNERFNNLPNASLESGYAMLYRVAGGSLDSYQTASAKENSCLSAIAQKLSEDLLSHWTNPVPGRECMPGELLKEWLGHRLSSEEAPDLHSFTNQMCGTSNTFTQSGEALIHPFRFVEHVGKQASLVAPRFTAVLHNDLHGGNLLCYSQGPAYREYQIIDFGLSTVGPAGFDHAYLELWTLLTAFSSTDAAPLIGILKALDQPERNNPLPDGSAWAHGILKSIREGIASWQFRKATNRQDDVERQFRLARVAAGINWANKRNISDHWKYLSLCYSGWAAKQYLERHGSAEDKKLFSTSVASLAAPQKPELEATLWNTFSEAVRHFSKLDARFVLIAESLRGMPNIDVLGQLPWSAVIDLDHDSEQDGLFAHAVPRLKTHRAIHISDGTINSSLTRGCTWMFACGRKVASKNPEPLVEWVTNGIRPIRLFIEALYRATTPVPLFVVIIPGRTLDPNSPLERLTRIADAAHEASGGKAQIFLVGRSDLNSLLPRQYFPLQVQYFLQTLHDIYGSRPFELEASVPGINGWRTIPLDRLRAMQECLVVLHSRVVEEDDTSAEAEDYFWRGRPATVRDLAEDQDLPRYCQDELVAKLRGCLKEHRNQTVLFYHEPGAGGTTAALRAAWELRHDYPVAFVQEWSVALVDRVESLFRYAEMPVLLVAEASTLHDENREDLYRSLRDRNCRVVLLYIRRVFSAPNQDGVVLRQELNGAEASSFREAFARFTTDPRRLQDLQNITTDEQLSRYRSPFFYGLITFEREYLGLPDFITRHLAGIREKARTLMIHLALFTIYSNVGLPDALCKRLRGFAPDSKLTPDDLLGTEASRLIVTSARRWRLLHRVIAEEVLAELTGDDQWHLDLVDLAIDLIHDFSRVTDSDSAIINGLLRELFVKRQSGGEQDIEDRGDFSPLISEVCERSGDWHAGKAILQALTSEYPDNPHFWNHLGRFQLYQVASDITFAEECLRKAVQLAPEDRTHHHTLGLVLREQVRQKIYRNKKFGASELLAEIDGVFCDAAAQFTEARNISPEDPHGYISHIQMITSTIDAIKRALGITSIGQIDRTHQTVVEWVLEQVSLAEGLLNDARRLYGVLDRGRDYLDQCETKISKLYGDLDDVIRIWEIADSRGLGSTFGRRALANAFLSRADRRWRNLGTAERRRIAQLMETNLKSSKIEEDYRLWFEASMSLPEFDTSYAITKLRVWCQRFSSWRAYYYLYIINFILWFSRSLESLVDMEDALEQCKRRAVGRKHLSEQWMAVSPSTCPVVSSLDLQPWDKDREFWSDGNSFLRRVNGVVKSINGPQAGVIEIDGAAEAFFVPIRRKGNDANDASRSRVGFERHSDEGKAVNFFLGFSPSGLRAWEVELGHVAGGNRSSGSTASLEDALDIVPEAFAMPQRIIASRLRNLQSDLLIRHAQELVQARSDLGAKFSIDELEERLKADFGLERLESAGFEVFRRWLVDICGFELVEEGSKDFVRGRPETTGAEASRKRYEPLGIIALGVIQSYNPEKHIGQISAVDGTILIFTDQLVQQASKTVLRTDRVRGRIVEFYRSVSKNPISRIKILVETATLSAEGVLSQEETLRNVKNRIIEEVEASSVPVFMKDVENMLEREYKGAIPLYRRMKYQSFIKLVEDIPTIRVFWKLKVAVLEHRRTPRLGKIEPGSTSDKTKFSEIRVLAPPIAKTNRTSLNKPLDVRENLKHRVRERLIGILASPNVRLSAAEVGNRVADIVGPRSDGRLRAAGYKKLSDLLKEIDGLSSFSAGANVFFGWSGQSPSVFDAHHSVSPTMVKGASKIVGSSKITEDLKRRIRERLVELTPSPSVRLDVAFVGNNLSDIIGPKEERRLKSAGYKKLSDLLREIEGFNLSGDKTVLYISRL